MGYTYSQIYVPPVRHNDKGETPPFKFSRELGQSNGGYSFYTSSNFKIGVWTFCDESPFV